MSIERSLEHWRVTGRLREKLNWTMDGQTFIDPVESDEVAVIIFDRPRGWRLEVTLNEARSEVETLTMDYPKGIDQDSLGRVPIGYVLETARSFLARYDEALSETGNRLDALALASEAPKDVQKFEGEFSLQEFARAWELAVPTVIDGKRLNKREVLAYQFSRSIPWVAQKIRGARDAGLLPPSVPRGIPKTSESKDSGK